MDIFCIIILGDMNNIFRACILMKNENIRTKNIPLAKGNYKEISADSLNIPSSSLIGRMIVRTSTMKHYMI